MNLGRWLGVSFKLLWGLIQYRMSKVWKITEKYVEMEALRFLWEPPGDEGPLGGVSAPSGTLWHLLALLY